ncbi:vanadium-dependent haloperoxidase [Catenovulum sp. SX2]|uniref:vanadium-dependent haloperoxidase n=1 Tax=Catenovulum sp. SX2 TaxID=3398614 RepID=UPI003F86453B
MTTSDTRAKKSYNYRVDLAESNLQAQLDSPVEHKANGDETEYSQRYPMSFTKGLAHDQHTGLIENPAHFEAFRTAIDNGYIEPFHSLDVPSDPTQVRRKWEAPTAGHVFDPQGPDAQAATMQAAPKLGSDELTFEMAEVYELAILRDCKFSEFEQQSASDETEASCSRLNDMPYAQGKFANRDRATDANNKLTPQTVFRGFSDGDKVGPYLSCFMLMGGGIERNSVEEGKINYGVQTIDQKVPIANRGQDFMTSFDEWVAIQNGYKPAKDHAPSLKNGLYETTGDDCDKLKTRFINTPRDLATYVHFDALYQAYLNACLILLSQKNVEKSPADFAPFDPMFKRLSGEFEGAYAGGFALFGGPHILSLVTEVATRALKAVRYQKFGLHRRLRPEVLAARVAKSTDEAFKQAVGVKAAEHFTKMYEELRESILLVSENYECKGLLPMAFTEGSPMHPAYGAGHATVAGACVTILKAFFDTDTVLQEVDGKVGFAKAGAGTNVKIVTEAGDYPSKLKIVESEQALTLAGELNKLAANISIGRNMAGVHYYSDYYDSVKLGEEIAIGILQDQAAGYPKDPFVLNLTKFDGEKILISSS